jgi:hypothetical protein
MSPGCLNHTAYKGITFEAVLAQRPNMIDLYLNGPRVMLGESTTCCGKLPLDLSSTPSEVHGGMQFYPVATIVRKPGDFGEQVGYKRNQVNRSLTMAWRAGWEVYQLVDPEGAVYTMQSFSRKIDYNLAYADLAGLGSQLDMPTGWSYRVVTLDEDLAHTAVVATVLMDDLANAYTRTQEPAVAPVACGEIKRAYKAQHCCGNPNNLFALPSSRRLSATADRDDRHSLLDSIKRKLSDAHTKAGSAKAMQLASKIMRVLEPYLGTRTLQTVA